MSVDRSVVSEEVIPPDILEQLVSRESYVLVFDEEEEKVVLLRSELYLFSVYRDRTSRYVYDEAADNQGVVGIAIATDTVTGAIQDVINLREPSGVVKEYDYYATEADKTAASASSIIASITDVENVKAGEAAKDKAFSFSLPLVMV